jgi:aryl-alcohol dehydrogenase-like predicted oxidoreductase
MQTRRLGRTDMEVSALSYGASSLGQEFRAINFDDALASVRTALDRGINFIDTSPFYGRGMSEMLLGRVLPDVPRDSYYLGTKLGRYSLQHFDFSARRVAESVDVSLERMRVDYLDIMLCHDIEFADLQQIVAETLPALRREVAKGKVRYIGVSGYPMKIFKHILAHAEIDVILTYNHYTLQNDMALELVPLCRAKGVGIMNAAPFSARLLTDAKLPAWHRAPPEVRAVASRAVEFCKSQGCELAQLAIQFSVSNPNFATCIAGSANPRSVAQWIGWLDSPVDAALVAEVQEILRPIHNWSYIEGRPENNDPLPNGGRAGA